VQQYSKYFKQGEDEHQDGAGQIPESADPDHDKQRNHNSIVVNIETKENFKMDKPWITPEESHVDGDVSIVRNR
jgi:hypothetical protein